MKLISFVVATVVAIESTIAAVLPQPQNEVCLCLGKFHCFMINGVTEGNNVVTTLTDDVYIHLPLSTFTVESQSSCTPRRKRGTDIDIHGSDSGAGVGVHHSSGNTDVHGSVNVDSHGHISGSGGISHQSGNTNTHGDVSVDSHGHVSGSAGVEHHSGSVHGSAGVSVDEHGHVSGHVGIGISFGRK